MIFGFEDFELDTGQMELRTGGEVIALEPKSFDLLLLLVQNHDRVLTRDEIFDQVWSGVFVTDASLSTAIAQIRRALGDDGNAQKFVKTVRGRGFRFVAPVTTRSKEAAPAVPAELIALPPENTVRQGPPVIVVLPFDLLATEDSHRAIAEAIPTDLIAALAQLKWVRVIARGSAFQFRGSQVSLPDIREKLGATYVLAGCVELAGQRLMIQAELIDARTQQMLWSDRYTGNIEDVFDLRARITREIATVAEYRLALNESESLEHIPSENLDAWGHYHKGIRAMFQYNQTDNEQAGDHFARAAALDPNFARAHAALSYTEFQNYFQQFGDKFEHHKDLALQHAENAMRSDPFDPYCNLMLGRAHWIAGEIEDGLNWITRSLELAPNYAFAFYNSALLSTVVCDGELAETHVASALVRSPVDPHLKTMIGTRALAAFVRHDEGMARKYADQAMRLPGAHMHVYLIAAGIHASYGAIEKAESALKEVRRRGVDVVSSGFEKHFQLYDSDRKETLFSALKALGA